jgi:hypothetical protein
MLIAKEIYQFLDDYFEGLTYLINSGPIYVLNPPFLPLTIYKMRRHCDCFEINHTQRRSDNFLLRTEWLFVKCDHFRQCIQPLDGGSDTNSEINGMLSTNIFGEEPRIFFLASWIKNLEQQGFLAKIREKINQRKRNRFADIDFP